MVDLIVLVLLRILFVVSNSKWLVNVVKLLLFNSFWTVRVEALLNKLAIIFAWKCFAGSKVSRLAVKSHMT